MHFRKSRCCCEWLPEIDRPGAGMLLIGVNRSPFTRRVAITLNIYGVPFEQRALSGFDNRAEGPASSHVISRRWRVWPQERTERSLRLSEAHSGRFKRGGAQSRARAYVHRERDDPACARKVLVFSLCSGILSNFDHGRALLFQPKQVLKSGPAQRRR